METYWSHSKVLIIFQRVILKFLVSKNSRRQLLITFVGNFAVETVNGVANGTAETTKP